MVGLIFGRRSAVLDDDGGVVIASSKSHAWNIELEPDVGVKVNACLSPLILSLFGVQFKMIAHWVQSNRVGKLSCIGGVSKC